MPRLSVQDRAPLHQRRRVFWIPSRVRRRRCHFTATSVPIEHAPLDRRSMRRHARHPSNDAWSKCWPVPDSVARGFPLQTACDGGADGRACASRLCGGGVVFTWTFTTWKTFVLGTLQKMTIPGVAKSTTARSAYHLSILCIRVAMCWPCDMVIALTPFQPLSTKDPHQNLCPQLLEHLSASLNSCLTLEPNLASNLQTCCASGNRRA